MLQRYGVLEEAGRESAAVWSRRPAMVEKEAGIGERGKTEKKITHLPFDRRFLVSSNCDGASDGKKQQQPGERRAEQGKKDWCFL